MSGYRPSFRVSEKKKILQYIIDNNLYSRVKGIAMWKDMEKDLNMGRTYQSMKDHFRRRLIQELHRRDLGLTPEQIHSLKQGALGNNYRNDTHSHEETVFEHQEIPRNSQKSTPDYPEITSDHQRNSPDHQDNSVHIEGNFFDTPSAEFVEVEPPDESLIGFCFSCFQPLKEIDKFTCKCEAETCNNSLYVVARDESGNVTSVKRVLSN